MMGSGRTKGPVSLMLCKPRKGGAYVEVERRKAGQSDTSNDRHEGQVHQGREGLLQEDGAARPRQEGRESRTKEAITRLHT